MKHSVLLFFLATGALIFTGFLSGSRIAIHKNHFPGNQGAEPALHPSKGIETANLDEWPDWRGQNRNAIWNEPGVVHKFPADSLPARWVAPLGSGYSGPTVANGRVYVTDRFEEPSPTEGILCFDEATGEKLWEFRYECEYTGIGYQAGPRASVVISGEKVYSLGAVGHLYCLQAETGEVLWQKDLNSEYGIKMPVWGIAATPLIYDEFICIQVGGSNNACIVALNKDSGQEIWRNLDDKASYSAPVLIGKGSSRVVVVWTEDHLAGMHPQTGEVFWKIPWKLRMGMGIATPVLYDDYLFVSAFYNGSMLVKLGDDYRTVDVVWKREGESERKTDALHCVMNTPVIIDGYIYGVDSYGELRCLELLTGDRVWENLEAVRKDRWANIHFVQNHERIWMFNEHGELIISELSPSGYKEISRAKIIGPTKLQLPRGVTWSHPAFAGKHVIVRNDNQLRSISLSK